MTAALDAAVLRESAGPVYRQIKEAIVERIRAGVWAPGDRMPSEHELVASLGVSRMTVHRALRELTQEGHLNRVHGVGTFVAEPVRHASLIELRNIADEVSEQGRVHRADVRICREVPATRRIAERMALAPDTPVFHALLVHYQDDTPIQIEDRYVNPAAAPAFLDVDFNVTTPTEYLISLGPPDEMEHIVQAVSPRRDEQRRLAVPADQPCLRLLRRTWRDGHVVTSASLLYPGNRYDLIARYTTNDS